MLSAIRQLRYWLLLDQWFSIVWNSMLKVQGDTNFLLLQRG